MTLSAGQAQLDSTSPVIGGSSHRVRDWNLFADPDPVRNDQLRTDIGTWPGADRDGARMLWIETDCRGANAAAIVTARDALLAAWRRSSTEQQLRFSEDGSTEFIYIGRTNGAAARSGPYFPTRCEFVATDPRRFSGAETTRTLGTHTSATNAGTVETIWRWEIAGPVTNPTLSIGDFDLTYVGTVSSGQTLIASRRLGYIIKSGTGANGSVYGACVDQDGKLPVLPDLESGATTIGGTSGGSFIFRSAWQ